MAESSGLILASGSRFRRDMLERAGIEFQVRLPDVDEDRIKNAFLSADAALRPSKLAEHLAAEKALDVSRKRPEFLVIGADQVLACSGEIFSKPPTLPDARRQLISLRGRTHILSTAVALAERGKIVWSHLAEPALTMRSFSDAFLDAYLAAEGSALCDTVGAYKFEGRGAQLFDTMSGDLFSVVGLPLLPLLRELRRRGAIAT